jgi:hypothetical protein
MEPRDETVQTPLVIGMFRKLFPQPPFFPAGFCVEEGNKHRCSQQRWPTLPNQRPTNREGNDAGVERVTDHRIDSVTHQLGLLQGLGKWGEVSTERQCPRYCDTGANDHQHHSPDNNGGLPSAPAMEYRQQDHRPEQHALTQHPDATTLKEASKGILFHNSVQVKMFDLLLACESIN